MKTNRNTIIISLIAVGFLLISVFNYFPNKAAAATAPIFIQEAETAWNSTASPKTTSSFSVQTGDVLVAYGITENSVASVSILDNTSSSGNWINQQTINVANYTWAGVWTKQVTSTESMTVTFTSGSGLFFGGNVLTFRGSSGVGASVKTNVASGAPTVNLTTTQANSAIVVVNGDWTATNGSSRSWSTNAGSFTEQTYFTDPARYTTYAGFHPDAGAIGTYAVGLSAPGAQKYSIAAVEIKGNSGGQSDTTPPTVSISSPAGGATVSGTTAITASANDNIGLAGVTFKLDGNNISSEDISAPYSINWDTTSASNGSHALTATARDTSNNPATSSSISVTVNNVVTPPPPPPPPPAGGTDIGSLLQSADRLTDWTYTGVPGGIPNRTTICATLNPGASASAINSALNSCSNGVVFLNAGTYNVTGIQVYNSNVTLRGAGADKTILKGSGILNLGNGFNSASGTAITGGGTRGSFSFNVASASGLSVGLMIELDRDNDPAVNSSKDPSRSQTQTNVITAISGNTITVRNPLFQNFSTGNPKIKFTFPSVTKSTGIEDLKLDHTGAGSGPSNINYCNSCWLKGVESAFSAGYHFVMLGTVNFEIRDSFIHDAQTTGPNNSAFNAYGNYQYGANSSAKIENNIFNKSFPAIEINQSSSGFYIGYNYEYGSGDWGGGQYLVTWTYDDGHAPFNTMNLYEGNTGEMWGVDGYFGGAALGTLMRNYITGYNPYGATGDAIQIKRMGYSYNFVGNVLGSTSQNPTAYETGCDVRTIYQLGYPNIGNCSTSPYDGVNVPGGYPDAKVKSSLVRWGNYDYFHNATQWTASEVPAAIGTPSQSLPNSFYYSSKPSWFPASAAWPLIGPEVVGGTGDTSGHVSKSPAQLCWESRNLKAGGTFSASSCYITAGSNPPPPPPPPPPSNSIITVNQTSNGSITPGTTTVTTGSNQTFTVTPNANFNISTVSVDGTNQTANAVSADLGTKGANTFIRSIANVGGGIVVGGGQTIIRSTDNGLSWTDLGQLPGGVIILKLVYVGNNTVLAGTTNGRIFRSTNGGSTWTDLGTQFSQTHVYGLANLTNGVVIAGTNPGGLILRSTDYGATWTNLGRQGTETIFYGMENLGNGIAVAGVGTNGNIYRSTDNGLTWTNLGRQGGEQDIDFIINLGNSTAIASTYPNGKLLRSTNNGLTWTDLGKFDSVDTMSNVASAGNGIAVAGGGKDGHLWRTTDYGATWSDLGQLGTETLLRSTFADNQVLLIGTNPGGKIYRITQSGFGTSGSYTFSNVQAAHTITAAYTSATITSPNTLPAGSFDEIRLSDSMVRGWSYDPDSSSSSNTIQIFFNGPTGTGTQVFSGPTGVLRSDVNSSFGITGNHGFEFPIPSQYKDGVSHSVYIYGIDINDFTKSFLLTGSPKSFTIAAGTPVPGDLNLDHIVNSIDYSILNSQWFTSNSQSDLNHDGIVNAIDFSILNANWLRTW